MSFNANELITELLILLIFIIFYVLVRLTLNFIGG